jgi:hypothetical protein
MELERLHKLALLESALLRRQSGHSSVKVNKIGARFYAACLRVTVTAWPEELRQQVRSHPDGRNKEWPLVLIEQAMKGFETAVAPSRPNLAGIARAKKETFGGANGDFTGNWKRKGQ